MRLPARLAPVVIAVAALVTWFPTWTAPYAEDDFLFLEAVSRPAAPGPLHYLIHEGVMDHHFRPLADPLAFSLLHAVSGRDPWGYHVLLMLLHVLAAWLVVRLARELSLPKAAGLLAGVIYVTRDFSFPSLVWASGVSDVGSAAAALGALTALARWANRSRPGWLVLAVALMLVAQLTKETAVVTIGLVPVVLALCGAPRRRLLAGTLPFLALGAPLALVALRLARFAGSGGEALYALSVGPHVLTLWPVYATWCLAGVRELLDASVVRWLLVVAAYVTAAALATGAARRVPAARRALLLGIVWLVVAASPALLAPQRVHTSYLALAAVGPVLATAWALEALRSRARMAGLLATAVVVLAGPVLVQAKASGRIESGGWIDTTKARRLEALVDSLHREIPSPPPGTRLLVFGGILADVRVLGDPRGDGFGPQQVLASAVRVRYGREDLEVLSLPPVAASPLTAFDAVLALLRERPAATRVIVAAGEVREVTGAAREVLRRGGGARDLARALAGS